MLLDFMLIESVMFGKIMYEFPHFKAARLLNYNNIGLKI